jgi:cysteinyl-tRNA synthetase
MSLRIYNTLSRKKEKFTTLEPGKVRMYVCGPTVYATAHIGHAMSALVFDIIRRYLEYSGYNVNFVVNYTDVDDKIINKANQTGQEPFMLAQKYIDDYRADLKGLNVKDATANPRATQEMEYIQNMVAKLIEADKAYVLDGDVYFRVNTAPDYGKLSGRKVKDSAAGSRISVDDRKESPEDFALWKSAKPGEPAWSSPWGQGRPGWHIECSAMNMHHLGEQIDIHGGGNDLIFPHHENEIAQTEALTGKEFARFWMHNGMVTMTGEKMSKSLGNIVSIQDFLKEHPGDVMRLWVLASNYRAPLVYGEDVIDQAEQTYKRLLTANKPALPGAKGILEDGAMSLLESAKKSRVIFIEAMDDDFNTPLALAHVIELTKLLNQARAEGASDAQLEPALAIYKELTNIWGLVLEDKTTGNSDVEPFIKLLLELRMEARAQKNWALSDRVRDGLKALGVTLEDSKEGTSWSWN